MPVPMPRRKNRHIYIGLAQTKEELFQSFIADARHHRCAAVTYGKKAGEVGSESWMYFYDLASEERRHARAAYAAAWRLRKVIRIEELQPRCDEIAHTLTNGNWRWGVSIWPRAIGFWVGVTYLGEKYEDLLSEEYRTLEDCETAARIVIAKKTAALAAAAAVNESEVAA